MYKACPCVFTRKEYQTPFDNYYEDDDNVEFENLLADPDSIPARLSRSPFQRSNSQGYLRINSMVAPDEETSLSSGHFDTLLEDDEEDNIQTADAQFLPDEQINKISEQVKFNQFNQMTDEQLIAEEEEETRLQEEEYNKKRQAAKQAALAKGLMTSEQAVLASPNNKTTFFTIEDDENGDEEDDDDDNNEGKKLGGRNNTNNSSSSNNNSNGNNNFVELSSNTNNTTSANTNINKTSAPNDDDSSNKNSSSILNLPRNPHARLFAADVNFDDYEDETEFDEQSTTHSKDVQTTIDDPLTRYSNGVTQGEV